MDSLPLAESAATPASLTPVQARIMPEAVPMPEMNRQERVIFTAYVGMAVLIAAFLVAAGVAWWLA